MSDKLRATTLAPGADEINGESLTLDQGDCSDGFEARAIPVPVRREAP